MIEAISVSVMKPHPSITTNSPTIPTYNGDISYHSDDYSQVSQAPLTQALQKLRSRSKSKSIARSNQPTVITRQNSRNILNGATRIPITNPTTHTPVLSQELSLEFQSDWSGDVSSSPSPPNTLSPSPSPSKISDSISQLRSKTIKALEHEDKRAKNTPSVRTSQQVRFAIDNPITTLEGLQKLRQKRALNKP